MMENSEFYQLMRQVEELKDSINNALDELSPDEQPYQTKETNELYKAFAVAQSELPPLDTNKVNPWFDTPYADIFHVGQKIYPVLGKHGLSIIQQSRVTSDGASVLYTRLCHESGQWIESLVRVIPPKNDIDSYRSTHNALRLTQILSLIGIGVANDPFDDDGEISMIEAREGLAKGPSKKSLESKKQSAETITKEQREELEYEIGEFTDLVEEILKRCHIRSLTDLPKNQFRNSVEFIRRNKRVREGKDI